MNINLSENIILLLNNIKHKTIHSKQKDLCNIKVCQVWIF